MLNKTSSISFPTRSQSHRGFWLFVLIYGMLDEVFNGNGVQFDACFGKFRQICVNF
jgi:hypothetical protein